MNNMMFFDEETKEYYAIDTDEKSVQLYKFNFETGEKDLFIETTPLELFNMLEEKNVRKLKDSEKAKIALLERKEE